MTPGSSARPSTTWLASGQPEQPWAVNSSTTTGSAGGLGGRTGRAPAGWAVEPTARQQADAATLAMIEAPRIHGGDS